MCYLCCSDILNLHKKSPLILLISSGRPNVGPKLYKRYPVMVSKHVINKRVHIILIDDIMPYEELLKGVYIVLHIP